MRTLLVVSMLMLQSFVAMAQHFCTADTAFREIRFPLMENDTTSVFWYFNEEWIPGASVEMVESDSINKIEVKNDRYGNRAVFVTLSSEMLNQLKIKVNEKTRELFVDYDPVCEFPGGNGKLKEWLEANIRVPEGYKGRERVVVGFRVQPDGSITNPKLLKRSKNNVANAEALRLVSALPKFRIKYFTPKKAPVNFAMPVSFNEPGATFIRGGETAVFENFPVIETAIRDFYDNAVFCSKKNTDYDVRNICTDGFLERLSAANGYDVPGYATWLLRSGLQDGQDLPSCVLSIIPVGNGNVIVNWSDMGIKGSTTLKMVESEGRWKIDDATVPDGFNPL